VWEAFLSSVIVDRNLWETIVQQQQPHALSFMRSCSDPVTGNCKERLQQQVLPCVVSCSSEGLHLRVIASRPDLPQLTQVIARSLQFNSHLTPHTSHFTPHTSHLTPHTSHLTTRSGDAAVKRVHGSNHRLAATGGRAGAAAAQVLVRIVVAGNVFACYFMASSCVSCVLSSTLPALL
jgi:hypothetical protein